MKSLSKKAITVTSIFLLLFIVGELCLRYFLGLANAPLYYASNEYEYIVCPNQDGYRFGNHYHYNSYSQRSEEPDSTKTILLGLGDSVLFGGVQTDQDSLATSIFTREMPGMQMLNISAGSWGPDNCAAYLRKFGLFGAKGLYLLVSSHDAYDNMNFQPVVGVHPSYPDKQYTLAWGELIDRYLLPRILPPPDKKYLYLDPDEKVLGGIRKDGEAFNPGFDELLDIARKTGIPLIVELHADASELAKGVYNEQGQEIIDWAKAHDVPLIKELDHAFTKDDYRDGIHLSAKGQRKVAGLMMREIGGIDLLQFRLSKIILRDSK